MSEEFYNGLRLINDHDVDKSIYSISNPPKITVTSDTLLHFSVKEDGGLRIYIGGEASDSIPPSSGSGVNLSTDYNNGNVILKIGG